MIERYSRPEISRFWTDEYRFGKWLEVELAVMEAWEELGRVPAGSAAATREKAVIRPERINELERETHHDIVAFVESISEQVGPLSAYFHLGLTSSDLLDTSGAMILREVGGRLLDSLRELRGVMAACADLYRGRAQVGRSHGIHAEPITLGLKFCGYCAELDRNIERLERARETVSWGKISGAVGTWAHLSPRLEESVCRKLGLNPETVSTQVVPRDRHAEFLCSLALAGGALERFALEVRHLQRTEVGEAAEPFGSRQKGSSAMPHKQNPILSERVCGLARILRANAGAALENIALWHERDISHSSVERVILPDSTILLDYMIELCRRMFSRLRVFPERLEANLELTGGLVFSQRVLSFLLERGLPRPEAYRLVQSNALASIEKGVSFRERLLADEEVMRHLSPEDIARAFDRAWFLRHEGEAYRRVFGPEGAAGGPGEA